MINVIPLSHLQSRWQVNQTGFNCATIVDYIVKLAINNLPNLKKNEITVNVIGSKNYLGKKQMCIIPAKNELELGTIIINLRLVLEQTLLCKLLIRGVLELAGIELLSSKEESILNIIGVK